MADLQGGKFGNGFAAAGVTQAFSGAIDGLDDGTIGISAERVAAAAFWAALRRGDIKGVISATIDGDGVLTAALKARKPISFTLDTNGNITITGNNLSVKTTIPRDKLGSGLSIGAFSVTAVADSAGNITFAGSAKIPVKTDLFGFKIVVSKTINLPNAFFNSSGLLGTAARAGRDLTQKIDDAERCAVGGGEGC
jgi:hypothetical protein